MKKIKAGIIGGAGYTGGELIRLLLLHPNVELVFIQSNSHAGTWVTDVHSDLLGETELKFIAYEAQFASLVNVLFLCGGHGTAQKFITENNVPESAVIIDLSQDFRHSNNHQFKTRQFIYGLPELNREKIKTALSVANPGCFATGIELALLPLAAAQLLNSAIHVSATTGSTGAGQALSNTSHFSWRSNNHSIYKAFEHQHLQEIAESITALQTNFNQSIFLIPQRGSFTRGIFCTVYFQSELSLGEAYELYHHYYSTHPFVNISNHAVDVKNVVNTNRCFLHLAKSGKQLLITSAIDNLLKGASGQAVQNMNLIFGLCEKTGLHLKPSAF